MPMIPKLTVEISKTADGKNDYLQVMSADMVSINVVLIAKEIEVNDARKENEDEQKK